MKAKNLLKKYFSDLTGLSVVNSRRGNPGLDLFNDLKYKFRINPEQIFDVGANIGQTCDAFSRNFPNAKIHCFEPVSETFLLLQKSWGQNEKISLNKIALGAKNETIELALNDPGASVLNSLKLTPANNSFCSKEIIQVETGNSYCKRSEIKNIDLLKIDTEGYEIEVLEGFSNFIQNGSITAIYAEVGFSRKNNRNTNLNDLVEYLDQHDFLFFSIYELCFRKIAHGIHFGNALFIHQSYLKKF